jgi:hypothetical protein
MMLNGVSGLGRRALRCCVGARWLPLQLVDAHVKWLARRTCYLCQPGLQQQLYRYQIDAGGRAMACRDRCGLWRVYLQSLMTIILEIEFSLFVVFFRVLFMVIGRCATLGVARLWALRAQTRYCSRPRHMPVRHGTPTKTVGYPHRVRCPPRLPLRA